MIIFLHIVGGNRVPNGICPLQGQSTTWKQGVRWGLAVDLTAGIASDLPAGLAEGLAVALAVALAVGLAVDLVVGLPTGLDMGLAADLAVDIAAAGLSVGLALRYCSGLPWGLPWDAMASPTAISVGTTVVRTVAAPWPMVMHGPCRGVSRHAAKTLNKVCIRGPFAR